MVRNLRRRTVLVDAAIEVLAREGARGLTFRAVDSEAGVPPGTASNYFSDRGDLLRQVAEHIHVRFGPSAADWEEFAQGTPSRDLVAEAMRALVRRISKDRAGYLALLELRLEATRRPELRDMLTGTVGRTLERDIRGHLEGGFPGDRNTVVLLYLAITGLLVEQLTLPGVLAGEVPEVLVTALVERLVPDS